MEKKAAHFVGGEKDWPKEGDKETPGIHGKKKKQHP